MQTDIFIQKKLDQPDFLWKKLLSYTKYIDHPENNRLLKKAFFYAYKHHQQQRRASGDLYFIHVYYVAYFLTQIKAGPTTIAAAFLHDVVEDTDITNEIIAKEFNEEIAFLVGSLTKVEKVFKEFSNYEHLNDINVKNIIVGMSQDIRVILLKLCDRLHNMLTLYYLKPEKQKRIAKETFHIYAPIASRLGIYEISSLLDDLCFKYLYPLEYKQTESGVNAILPMQQKTINESIEKLTLVLNSQSVGKIYMYGRIKTLWSIYNKVQKKNLEIADLYDILAIRIIVDSKEKCYQVLGLLHNEFPPVGNRFKDYIAVPKPNLYRSLHTTLNINEKIVEIQIRTQEMDFYANQGIAAHWRYKKTTGEQKKSEYTLDNLDNKLNLISELKEFHLLDKSSDNLNNYVDVLSKEIFRDYVYVLTPAGKTITLPQGSTVLDFAFKIHSKLVLYVRSCQINGITRPLEYELETGDIVKIIKSDKFYFNKNYVNKIFVPKNKARFLHLVKKHSKEDERWQEEYGKNLCFTFLKKEAISDLEWNRNLREFLIFVENKENVILDNTSKFYVWIATNKNKLKENYHVFLTDLKQKEHSRTAQSRKIEKVVNVSGDITFDKVDLKYRLSNCCLPVYDEPITGFVTNADSIHVHRLDCKQLKGIDEQAAKKFVNSEWNPQHNNNNTYLTKFIVYSIDTVYTLLKINSYFANSPYRLNKVRGSTYKNSGLVKIILHVIVNNIEDVEKIISKINYLKETRKCER